MYRCSWKKEVAQTDKVINCYFFILPHECKMLFHLVRCHQTFLLNAQIRFIKYNNNIIAIIYLYLNQYYIDWKEKRHFNICKLLTIFLFYGNNLTIFIQLSRNIFRHLAHWARSNYNIKFSPYVKRIPF